MTSVQRSSAQDDVTVARPLRVAPSGNVIDLEAAERAARRM
jgi:hypothetical protein